MQNNLSEFQPLIGLYLKAPNKPDILIGSLTESNYKHSQTFYILANSILNVNGQNYTQIKDGIDNILLSTTFLNLSEVEQTILIVSGETYLDSYQHWTTN
jgi:hypothetical protein